MTSEAAKKAKAKRARRPIYATIQRVAVMETGEHRLAILASHPIDRRLMKERGYRDGDEVRIEIKRPRNGNFHRLLHAIGGLMVDNVEDFRDLDSHEAVKRLQRESGVCCESMEIDLGTLGKVPVSIPMSLAFDEMDQSDFEHLFKGVTEHVAKVYSHVMMGPVLDEFWMMVNGDQV